MNRCCSLQRNSSLLKHGFNNHGIIILLGYYLFKVLTFWRWHHGSFPPISVKSGSKETGATGIAPFWQRKGKKVHFLKRTLLVLKKVTWIDCLMLICQKLVVKFLKNTLISRYMIFLDSVKRHQFFSKALDHWDNFIYFKVFLDTYHNLLLELPCSF